MGTNLKDIGLKLVIATILVALIIIFFLYTLSKKSGLDLSNKIYDGVYQAMLKNKAYKKKHIALPIIWDKIKGSKIGNKKIVGLGLITNETGIINSLKEGKDILSGYILSGYKLNNGNIITGSTTQYGKLYLIMVPDSSY